MIHHLSFGTNDVEGARAFYDPVMAVLGLRRMESNDKALDYGMSTFILSIETPVDGRAATAGNGVHIAFAAQNRTMVDAFHATALANGGTDAGAPGVREVYDPHYYGAFVFDPDGNKLETVTFEAK